MSNLIINPYALVAGYIANGVIFDGTNDYLTRGANLTGLVDGKEGIISFWLDLQGGDGTFNTVTATSAALTEWFVGRNGSNRFIIRGRATNDVLVLEMLSNTTYTASNAWLHVLMSWDLANTTGWLYIDDVNDLQAGPTFVNANIDYTQGNFSIGGTTNGASKLNAYISDLYVNTVTHFDLSVESNRRKFIDANGKPVDLGSDGSTPTGSQPIVFHKGPASGWHTNQGSGGGMTLNGALADAPTSPSD